MKKITISLFPAIFLWFQPVVFAQDSAPDDTTTAMTIDAGEAIDSNDFANNEDVPGDSSYVQPEGPYGPEIPESGETYEGPVGVTGIFNGNVSTGCSYDPLGHSAIRTIDDIVVPGGLGKYPLKMTRYYNSRQQYYGLGAIALSPGWSHEYSWLLWSDGHKVVSAHGGVYDDFCGAPVGVSEGWEQRTNQYNGTWRLADGGKVIFVNGAATYIDDPYGVRTTITYGPNGISRVTEAGGRYLQFSYGPASDPDGTLLLTRVEAHALGNATVTDWVNYSYTLVSAGVQGRNKKMLTGVAYSDGSSASYQYRTDNVTEGQTTHKDYPLLQRCDDVRYSGPMRTIRYEYDNGGPHGAIINEKYPGYLVSAISPRAGTADTFTETRGDGPTRSFTYTHMFHCHGTECGPCDDVEGSNPPHPMLTSYTDFQGHTTILGYDSNWYINSVRDANTHTTAYTRGPGPPTGIGQITRITHPGGAHIDYTYYNEGTGHIGGHYINTITDERSNVTVYNRDGNHRVTSINYKNNQDQVVAHEEFVYNNFGQVTRHKLKNGKYVHYQYNGRGLLTAKWNPTPNDTALSGDPKTTYTYWTNAAWADRVYQTTLPANTSNQAAYDRYEYDRNAYPQGAAVPGRGLVTKITHADGKYQSLSYSQFGTKMWEENELRQRTSYTYDNYNRVLSAKNPLNKIETFNYLKPGTGSAYLHTTDSVYTHTSRAGIVTTNVYDPNWRKTSTKEASGTLNLTTRFAYDNVGNLTDVTDPRNKITHHGYDNRDRKTSTTVAYGITGLAATTVFHYDAASNINRIDRPDGVTETKVFDALNRMTSHTVPRQVPGGNPINLVTRFSYNPSGTLQHVTDPNGRQTAFLYDPSDRKTRMTYPGGSYQEWTYDNAGNLASRRTVNNETQNFTYDNRNRKTEMSWSNGADSASYSYDDASRLLIANNSNSNITRAYDAAGRLTQDQQSVTGLGIKTVSYPSYDDDARLKQVSTAGIYDYTFGYDAAGRFKTISTGGSTKFEYDYDAASNETHRYTYLSGVTIDQVYNRDSLNRMSSRLLKKNGTTIAGTTEAYTYDHMNRLTEVNRGGVADGFTYYWSGELWTAQYGGGVRAPFNEEQDPDLDTTDTVDLNAAYQPPDTEEPEPAPPPDEASPPDLTADTTPSPDSTPPSDTPPAEDPTKEEKTVEDYLGDGNLAPEGPGPEVPTSGRNVAYHLDKAGNRTSVTDDANGNATYVPNNLNQYTSVHGSSVGNGSEHEIRTYNSVTYTYINDEHLKQVSSGSNNYYLYYDALGRCVKRVLNGATTYYIYDGEKPILEYRSTDLSHPAKNVYGKGIDEILMRYDPSFSPTVTYYYQQDHEGSVTHLLNTSGNVIEKYQYDAFGLPFIYDANGTQLSSSAYSNRFLFTGREYANLFGFYEYRARAYHPILGRFMSEDPKLFDAGDYNLFRYCHNDPVDLTDPMGLYAKGEGWTPDQWKKFDQAQQTASRQLEKAVNRIVLAREAGKESKEFKSLSKDFQKIFGKEATAENLSKVAHTAREMITALRDDGRNGHIANAMSSKEIMANFRGTDRDTMAVGVLSGTKIYVNLEHRSFGKASALSWAAGHESAHNVGLKHGMLNGVTAYKYGKEQERETYRMLPSVAPDEAIHNPDNFMDFAR